jgi:preprotein translocase subunit SecE
MASKAAVTSGEEQPVKLQGAVNLWNNTSRFLSDVRAEMRKVVTPTRKEVQATTTVVIITVFIFAGFFFVADFVFNWGMGEILTRLGGKQ